MAKFGYYWKDYYSANWLGLVATPVLLITFCILSIFLCTTINYFYVYPHKALSDKHIAKLQKENSDGWKNIIDDIKRELKAINRIHWLSKLLTVTSLLWSVLEIGWFIGDITMRLYFNLEVVTCGQRSGGVFCYSMQRISMVLFFILRLNFSFSQTKFEMPKVLIYSFSFFAVFLYMGGAVWYEYEAVVNGDGYQCPSSIALPIFFTVSLDVVFNCTLVILFVTKLRQVQSKI